MNASLGVGRHAGACCQLPDTVAGGIPLVEPLGWMSLPPKGGKTR